MSDKSDEESVLGSLPATRPTRFGRERRESGGTATKTVAKPRPKKAAPKAAARQAGAGTQAPPGPRRRARAARVDGARPHRRAAAGVDDHAPERHRARHHRHPGGRRAGPDRPRGRRPGAQARGRQAPEALGAATFPRAESPGYQPGERGTQCGSVVRGGESAGLPAVALLSLREPVSSPRRQRRKPMRTLTTRIAVLIAAFAVISPSALAQAPSGGADGAGRRARARAVPALRRRRRPARQEGALPRHRRREARRPPGRRPGLRPRHRGVDQAGQDHGQARRHVRRPLEAAQASASSAPAR